MRQPPPRAGVFTPPTHDHDLENFSEKKQFSSKVLSVVDELQMWLRYFEEHHGYKIVQGPGFMRAQSEFDYLEILWSPK